MPSREPSTALVLSGLDGGNPLAFLAAVGTLRAATRAAPSAGWTMRWKTHDGHWSPVLVGGTSLTEDGLVELLMPALKTMDGDPALCFADDPTVGREQFREVAQAAQRVATLADRHFADFVAAFGCDSLSVPRKDQIQDTALRTMSGAGHQHLTGADAGHPPTRRAATGGAAPSRGCAVPARAHGERVRLLPATRLSRMGAGRVRAIRAIPTTPGSSQFEW